MQKKITEKIEIAIKVSPGASQNSIVGIVNGELKVRITARPIKGAANEALIAFLSKELKIPKSQIKIIKGETSSHKRIQLIDFDPKQLDKLLLNHRDIED